VGHSASNSRSRQGGASNVNSLCKHLSHTPPTTSSYAGPLSLDAGRCPRRGPVLPVQLRAFSMVRLCLVYARLKDPYGRDWPGAPQLRMWPVSSLWPVLSGFETERGGGVRSSEFGVRSSEFEGMVGRWNGPRTKDQGPRTRDQGPEDGGRLFSKEEELWQKLN
jgi:hypothetical protein